MAYLLDLAVILIFAAAVFVGFKRGFIKSMIGVVGFLAAMVLAFSISGAVAGGIYSSFVQKKSEKAIETAISDKVGASSIEDNITAAMDTMPNLVKDLIADKGLTAQALAEKIGDGTQNTANAIAVAVTDTVVKPVMTLFIRFVACIVLFILLQFAVTFIGKFIAGLLRHTPLKGADSLLGALLGAVKGVLWVLFAVMLMQAIAGFTAEDALISQKSISETKVVSFVADHNPLFSNSNTLIEQFNDLLNTATNF